MILSDVFLRLIAGKLKKSGAAAACVWGCV